MMSVINTFVHHVQDSLTRTIEQGKDIEMYKSWKGKNKTL